MNDKTSLNEGIKVIESKNCLLCGTQGSVVYEDQRDRSFEAPGVWSIMYCNKCDLAWINPKPIAEDIPKLYSNYFTHNIDFPNQDKPSLRKYIKGSIIKSSFGYDVKNGSKILAVFYL